MELERIQYNEVSPWWGEHVHRYQEVIRLINNNCSVLDLACGNGYGTYLISKVTTSNVVGGDISNAVVEECKQRFKNDNLHYEQMDGTQLPFHDQLFDIIVSFETIEHTTEYNTMLTEFHRVLKPDGVLFISTPNIIINSPNNRVINPFHTQEFNFDELKKILNTIFEKVTIYGQKYKRYSNRNIKNMVAKSIESFFYLKGIRKLPISFQNKIMSFLIKKNMYPFPDDYVMVSKIDEINLCKTFFAICQR